jgi:hypothetical protein
VAEPVDHDEPNCDPVADCRFVGPRDCPCRCHVDPDRAERTTPATAGFVDVDPTRTFLVFGAFTESMVGLAAGEAPRALVRADLTGKWNHGAEDKPVLIVGPQTAREWGETLIEAADAAEADLARFLRTGRAS